MISVILIVSLVTWALVKYVLHVNQMESYLKHVKTKQPWMPYIGNTSLITMKSVSDLFKESFEFALSNGTPFKANIGPVFYVVLDKPEDVKLILMSPACLDKPYSYSFYPLPLGLLTQRCKRLINV